MGGLRISTGVPFGRYDMSPFGSCSWHCFMVRHHPEPLGYRMHALIHLQIRKVSLQQNHVGKNMPHYIDASVELSN